MPPHPDGGSSPSDTTSMMPNWTMKEDIVISGISGRFPECENMDELKQNLFNEIDMVHESDRRWTPGIFGIPKRHGHMKCLDKFDADFFGVNGKFCEAMDPQLRIVLEVAYEAIVDAGYEPSALRGKNIGVFTGICTQDAEGSLLCLSGVQANYLGIVGTARCMVANYISFAFGFNGPSYIVDTACSSSATALENAVTALRNNKCSAAIVAGVSVHLKPAISVAFWRLGVLSPDGKCKVFDDKADGYVRSEAISAIFLQKASDSRRIYATVVHVKCNDDGIKNEGITFPSARMQECLLKEVYAEAGIHPRDIAYIEAHGTGTTVGDVIEMEAVSAAICEKRETPLLMGSIKTNMGHAEGSSAMCQIAKVILAMEEGVIPSNLHFSIPNSKIPSLTNGQVKIITEKTPWRGGLVGISSFGFGGANVHAILKSHESERVLKRKDGEIPRLVLCCGRLEETTMEMLRIIERERYPDEAIVLLEEVAKAPPSSMPFRGFSLLKGSAEESIKSVQAVPTGKRQVWFIFPGMGSQWKGMAQDMMKLEIFAQSIRRSAEYLKPFNIDLLYLVTNGSSEELGEITNAFVTIAAVQIALVDLIKALDIAPDGIVGHSFGELGCAYVSGGFTAEQTILFAYWRGQSCKETALPRGAMAAINLSWQKTKSRCPKEVEIACYNSPDLVTISGPNEKISSFVKELQSENIFAREVKCGDLAFHSHYTWPAAPVLQRHLKKTVSDPKPRCSKWISSSIPESNWNDSLAKFCSAEYFVNNFRSPVLFTEAMSHVPSSAIVIEFSPHASFGQVVKQCLGKDVVHIGLMKRNSPNGIDFFLSAIGKLYQEGFNPNAKNLYDKISFPVPLGTPMLSPLVQWDHSQSWIVPVANDFYEIEKGFSLPIEIDISSRDSKDYYLTDHFIEGRVLFPATGYLHLIWHTLSRLKTLNPEEMPIVFENVAFHRATVLPKSGTVTFLVDILGSSGQFEIREGSTLVANGRAFVPDDPVLTLKQEIEMKEVLDSEIILNNKDIYKELRLRGLQYGPAFQGLLEATSSASCGKVLWNGNYVTFMDSMMHLGIISDDTTNLRLPLKMKRVKIDPRVQSCLLTDGGVSLYHSTNANVCFAGGVEMMGLEFSIQPLRRAQREEPSLYHYQFSPAFDPCVLNAEEKENLEDYIQTCSSVANQILQKSSKTTPAISKIVSGVKEVPYHAVLTHVASNENYTLLSLLTRILNEISSNGSSFEENVKNHLVKYQDDVAKDILSNVLITEARLRTLVDVVVENVGSTNIKALEVFATSPFLKNFGQIFSSIYPEKNFHYSAVNVNFDNISDTKNDDFLSVVNMTEGKQEAVHLLIAKDISQSKSPEKTLKMLKSALVDGGFILLLERTAITPAEKILSFLSQKVLFDKQHVDVESLCHSTDISVIGKKSDGLTSSVYLLHRRDVKDDFVKRQKIVSINNESYAWVDELREAMVSYQDRPDDENVWVVAKERDSGVIGLVNCLRNEPGGEKIRCIFAKTCAPEFSVDNAYYKAEMKKDLVMNVYQDGQWGAYHHLLINKDTENVSVIESDSICLTITNPGNLSTLQWVELPRKILSENASVPGKHLCQVYFTALNFRDVLYAIGRLPLHTLPQNCRGSFLGMEFSGKDASGKRVMGIVPAMAIATSIVVDSHFVFEVPNSWTLQEASTVPVVYLTVYYAMIVRGNLRRGQTVLIHSGSGGVGQAAITVALSMDCNVFTTVGSAQKRDYLKKKFPQLTDRNISDSRSVRFKNYILQATNGRGVDVVLNSLAEEKLQASVDCLAPCGRFVEIGKYDLSNNTPLGMSMFFRNAAFHGVQVEQFFEDVSDFDIREAMRLFKEGINSGVVKPLDATVFNSDQSENAIRYMADGKHTGKVVIKIRDEEIQKASLPKPITMTVHKQSFCHSQKSYIVIGGFGGMGIQLCHWLISRGCCNIVISSRTTSRTSYQKYYVQRWKSLGVNVVVSTENVATIIGATALIKQAQKLGPVAGIFNVAMVLKEANFVNHTAEDFKTVCASKATATKNLDSVTRQLCKDLEWFVVFSSMVAGFGRAGLSSYGYANAVMERICEQRKEDGLPALAVQWGPVGDVGFVHESVGSDALFSGHVPQKIRSCLETLGKFLSKPELGPVVASLILVDRNSDEQKPDLLTTLCNIIGMKDKKGLKDDVTLGELGMDSLLSFELLQTLDRDYHLPMKAAELQKLTIKDIEAISQSNGAKVKITPPTKTSPDREDVFISVPKTVIVPIKSKSTRPEPIFLIHPIEGKTDILYTVCSLLENVTYGVECTVNVPLDTIGSMAKFYVQELRTKQPRGPYRICGYSFGAVVAYEMAIILQTTYKEKIEYLMFLDSYPGCFSVHISGSNETNDDDILKLSLRATAVSFLKEEYNKVLKKVDALPTLDQQLDSITDMICKKFGISHGKYEVRQTVEAAIQRRMAFHRYKVSQKFQGDTTVVVASDGYYSDPETVACTLKKVIDGKVCVNVVNGDHTSFLKGDGAIQVAKIINDNTM